MSDRSIFGAKTFLPLLVGIPLGIILFQWMNGDTLTTHERCATWAQVIERTLPSVDAAVGSASDHGEGLDNLKKLSHYYDGHGFNDEPAPDAGRHLIRGVDDVVWATKDDVRDSARLARGMTAINASVAAIAGACQE